MTILFFAKQQTHLFSYGIPHVRYIPMDSTRLIALQGYQTSDPRIIFTAIFEMLPPEIILTGIIVSLMFSD